MHLLRSLKPSLKHSAILCICAIVYFVLPGKAGTPPPSVLSNGMFAPESPAASASLNSRASENGIFTCTFQVDKAGCAFRILKDFRFCENGLFRFSLTNPPGSDVSLSNAGYVLFSELKEYSESEVTLHCYAKNGLKIFSKFFNNAQLFEFSPRGNLLGIGNSPELIIIDLSSGKTTPLPCRKCWQFAISADESYVVVACENEIVVFTQGMRTASVATGMAYTRKVSISLDSRSVAVIDKKILRVFSLPGLMPLFSDTLTGSYSFRDLRIAGNTVWAGVHYRDETASNGYLKTYDLSNGSSKLELKSPAERLRDRSSLDLPGLQKSSAAKVTAYPQIPWPFSPQNQPHMIWNNYEALNTATDGDTAGAYLHQGVDMHCPAYTRVYAVMDGIVKCRLTFASNPSIYWRIATAEAQDTGWSNGWLYAHLVQTTIQFDVGDTVRLGDYIAQIVPWDNVGGHIHFARIRDHGRVWTYAAPADEWGILYNPELSLTPMGDTKAPVIMQARPSISKFAYCRNETVTYLAPNNLTGDIDIIVKCFDTIGTSDFRQPAFAIYYWIKRRDNGVMAKDTTRGEWRNHYYPMYEATEYHPWALLQFKVDRTNFSPGGWFTRSRPFAHIITNRCGDSIITLGNRDSSLHTNIYARTWHRLFVKVCDASGNCTVDSEDVYFAGGVGVSGDQSTAQKIHGLQAIPGHSSSGLKIFYTLPEAGEMLLGLYDLAGNEVAVPVQGFGKAGNYSVNWDGSGKQGYPLGYGTYLCVLKTKHLTEVRTISYCR